MNILSLTYLTAITFTFIIFIFIALALNPGKENEAKRAKYLKYSVLAFIIITGIPIVLALLGM